MDELDKAHKDYLIRKNEIIIKLTCVRDEPITKARRYEWVDEAINFLKEREI